MKLNAVKKTVQTQKHKPIGYSYRVVSDLDPEENFTVQYTAKNNEEDVSLHFVKSVYETVKNIGEKYAESRPMDITEEQQKEFDEAERCWLCQGKWGEKKELKKVRDHCHFTGEYRGAAHSKCNLSLKQDKTIPVLFHNGGGYDFHLLVKNLGKLTGEIDEIAKNEEQHISVTKKIPLAKSHGCQGQLWKMRFLDSCGFLQASLSDLLENLKDAGKENFKVSGEEVVEEKRS